MAIKKYTVEVVRTDEFEIEIDDSIYTDEFIETWSESFYDTEEGSRQEDFVKHLASGLTRAGIANGLEGFGYVKQKFASKNKGVLLSQYSQTKKITEEDYSPGISVKIHQYDDDYQTEIFENEKS